MTPRPGMKFERRKGMSKTSPIKYDLQLNRADGYWVIAPDTYFKAPREEIESKAGG